MTMPFTNWLWRAIIAYSLSDGAFVIPDTIPYGEIYFFTKGHYIGTGATSFVDRLESGHIIKYPKPNPYCPEEESLCRQQMEIEAEAYKRIGDSPRVPKLIHWDSSECSLVLEFLAEGDLPSYLERCNNQAVTAEQRRVWMKHAAEAVAVVHSATIIHCDVTPRNFLLNEALELHLADFAGSSVAGSRPSITTSARFQRPGWSWEPAYADDLFALGSVLYYIQTGREPYHDIPENEVRDLFQAAAFPNVSTLDYGSVIHKCWTGDFSNAQQIIDALAIANLG
ncbi:kinase-like domain [Cordyceps militaris]|uniref:EKC/KEOPS complex subunit BUD32 n=1 Tax=Cordyceps militaris TaxID=73501 RepID=A0A2H4SHB7_CORMI|nr:kinase-like domain [Cordyceps militaris]